MGDHTIEFRLTTKATWPVPAGHYHWPLMPMHQAYALEYALQQKDDYFGWIQRATHPDMYPEPNPNPYTKEAIDPCQGLTGFRFEVLGTDDIREAYRVVYEEIMQPAIGNEHDLEVDEVMVSRMHTSRGERYHPIYNPTGL